MVYRKVLRIGLPIVAAAGAITAAELYGATDWMVGYEINRISYFGEWARNLGESLRPLYRIGSDIAVGGVAAGLMYLLQEGLAFKRR